ncbi:MAG: CDP-6-deoxy-delta-3,4-glucoseen reductase [Lautropia sp.]|nr:CDP-6-deoxy-delta-3,4-glucoseen reductase [Lautropia sp.]
MTFNVTIEPSGKQFSVDADASILEAALEQGVVLPYGCKNGACGSCKAQVMAGSVVQGDHQPAALSAGDISLGYALLCTAKPTSDLLIEAHVVEAAGEIPVKKLPCRVRSIEPMAPDVRRIRLQLPYSARLLYLAGQYVDLIFPDGTRRSYSMATAPDTIDDIELHVRHLPGGHFTDRVFGVGEQPALKVREIFRLEGPLGTFFLREDGDKPIVLLASGTGFAPIKAIVERMLLLKAAGQFDRPVHLYWGGRRPQDIYQRDLCEQWTRELPGFVFVPVLSDALPEDGWTGRTGFVHHAVMADWPDLSGHEVYVCGAPVVVESARRDFVAQCGLPPSAFFADAFTSEADRQAQAA